MTFDDMTEAEKISWRTRVDAIKAAGDSIAERIEFKDFDNDPTGGSFFKEALFASYGVENHPRADRAYHHAHALARGVGGATGSFRAVLEHFNDLVTLLEIGVAAREPASPPAAKKPLRLGVAVVVTMLPYPDADLLILWGKRRGSHGAGTWAFAGGEVQPGESVVEAAARELREETGIDVPVSEVEMIHHAQPVVQPNGERWVCFVATVRVPREIEAQLLEPEKCEAWTWRGLHDLPSPVFPPNQVQINDGVLDDIELHA